MHGEVTVRTRMCVTICSNCHNVKLQNDSVTLTFKVGTWYLKATHRLYVRYICAKLFQNLTMYDKVTVQTRMKWRRTERQDGRKNLRLHDASLRGHNNEY
jgi:hypothetical protein